MSEEGQQQYVMGHQLTFLPGLLCQLITRSDDIMVTMTFSHNLHCKNGLNWTNRRTISQMTHQDQEKPHI